MLDMLVRCVFTAWIEKFFHLTYREEDRVFLSVKRSVVTALIFCICMCTSRQANANVAYASDGKAAGVIVAVVGVAALAGFGVYYTVHHSHNLKGCTAATGSGLTITRDGSQDTYMLSGEIQGIKAGDRVQVSGNKVKDQSKGKGFVVTKPSKDYGACKTT